LTYSYQKMGVKQNLNLYWVAGTALAVWMLFVNAPRFLANISVSPTLMLHLIGVYPIYLACIHNTLITPTTFSWARTTHVWVGRIGLIMGVVGFITGVVLTWYLSFDPDNMGGNIGITVGGITQMIGQVIGYHAIKRHQHAKAELAKIVDEVGCEERIDELRKERDEALKMHVCGMLFVFLVGCSFPSIMRIPVGDNNWIAYILMVICATMCVLYCRMLQRRITENSDRKTTAVNQKEVSVNKANQENVDSEKQDDPVIQQSTMMSGAN